MDTMFYGRDDGSIFVVDRVALGEAVGVDGTRYGVIATKHNKDWPGTGSPVTFAVERYAVQDGALVPVEAWGFFKEEECYLFLTSRGKVKNTVYDRNGEAGISIRQGLKVPEGLVSRSIPSV
jgi:hypothetical protein